MDASDPRRARILASARDVFAREGFRRAEVKTIASAAGVGKATIYRFFQSKDALLLTVVEENLTTVRDLVLRELLSAAPPLTRLENVCRAVARFLERERDFSRLLIQEAGEFLGPIQLRYLRLVDDNLPVADAFFEELRREGYFVELPTRDTLLMMVNLLVGTTYTWVLTGEGELERQALAYMRVLVRGLRAS
ncbi:TetR/AcrR family transcriptional regulator [Alloalcanivorax marinus]|uniref:TetR/AcrR family transcriptional regulator n=1 Tax=Alloalcanivorax marinus TaxID=1177169 RepID=UPI001932168D|nr:TetR/AcrR family transcriptional regulator [Alloalcanivorax marinus]MBL7251948.1 TetR/AcrR family transcriptional regulator [Alloalcanivorax marinus]